MRDWRELKTAPMTLGECMDGVVHVAKGAGFMSDDSVTDRGMGIWQSRWRGRVMRPSGNPARYRLYLEVLVEEGSAADGWPIRYTVDQEKVDDLRRSIEPREEDWSSTSQDSETEAILGEAFVRRLAPKPMPKREAPKAP